MERINQSARKKLHVGRGIGVNSAGNRLLTDILSQKLDSKVHGFEISDGPWRAIALAIIALMLSGCMQSTLAPTTEAGWSARDKQLMSNLPYAQATIPVEYRRHIVQYTRKEAPGTIVVDTGNKISLLRAAEGAGDPLRHHRRRARASLERRRHGWPQGGMAVVDADRR